MNNRQTLSSIVTRRNGDLRGPMPVQIDFRNGTPCKARHDGLLYVATGNQRIHRVNRRPMLEMVAGDHTRLWISLDGTRVWEG